MTATTNVVGPSNVTIDAPDRAVSTKTTDAGDRCGNQWRYASAIDAARALNAPVKSH
jgi:hypothetical protein